MNFSKNLKKMNLKTMRLPILCLALAVSYSSCKDEKNSIPTPELESATISVFHASPLNDSLAFYLDDKRVNKDSIGLGDSINYVEVLVGNRTAEVKGSDGESILSGQIALEGKKSYSLFIANEQDKEAEFIQISDDLTKPAEGKAKIRFVNVSADAGTLNLKGNDETDLFTEVDYKSASEFTEINEATQSFKIIDNQTSTELFSLENIEIEAGKIYTIWVTSLKESDTDLLKIEAKLFRNN